MAQEKVQVISCDHPSKMDVIWDSEDQEHIFTQQ